MTEAPPSGRLTVKGNFIRMGYKTEKEREEAENKNEGIYLDGEVFGIQNVRLTLPSGNEQRGGDPEMWFWLTPKG